jgi:hypothetical protein
MADRPPTVSFARDRAAALESLKRAVAGTICDIRMREHEAAGRLGQAADLLSRTHIDIINKGLAVGKTLTAN